MLRAPTPPYFVAGLALIGLASAALWAVRFQAARHATSEQVLGIVSVSRIQSLDPDQQAQTGTVAIRNRLLQALREGLVEFDPRLQAPVPAMAESWDIAADSRSAVFHLRPGLRWNNGEPLVAADFEFAFRRALSVGSAVNESLMILRNGRAFANQRLADPSLLGVTAVDPVTLRLDFEHPVPGLLMELCDPAWVPLHAASLGALENGSYWLHPSQLVTNGPFELAQASADRLVLRPNPHYRARSEIHLASVEMLYTEDAALYPRVLQAGRAQLSDRLASGDVAIAPRTGIELWRDPTLATGWVHFNLRQGPLADRRVRQALSLALDRSRLASEVSTVNVRAARACLPPVNDWDDVRTVREDLSEAKRLLGEAGYPDGRGFPVLTWPYRNTGTDASVRLPEVCSAQWRDRLGLQIYLLPVDEDEFQHRLTTHGYDVVLAPVVSPLPDLTHLASQLITARVRAYSGWDGAGVARLLEKAREARRDQVHDRILAFENAYLDEMPATPLIFYNRHTLKSLSVGGWYVDSTGQHPLKYLSLTEAPLAVDD
ncbi:MAG TPA: peptide ABC transporter substrate-binding protein [Candidatus Didemnitutus sp.]|nr:peptide ABC transporter substrate-binding protein [Candidatus Didemnitutus sp.]